MPSTVAPEWMRSIVKKQSCANTGARQFIEPWDHFRLMCGTQPTHCWPWNACGRLHASRTPQRCVQLTLPTPLVHCTERVLGALDSDTPFFLPYLEFAWHELGSVLWTRGPNGWQQHATPRGVPHGAPLSVILFVLAVWNRSPRRTARAPNTESGPTPMTS